MALELVTYATIIGADPEGFAGQGLLLKVPVRKGGGVEPTQFHRNFPFAFVEKAVVVGQGVLALWVFWKLREGVVYYRLVLDSRIEGRWKELMLFGA